ncbi:MAG: STT3 domain-containing protein, partial [Candidatus Thermoplasmatota archaeon]
MAEFRGWLRRNWTTPVILLAIFLVALYLRAYFPWDLAVQDRLLSGGSDSFYYERIINFNVETGQQLVRDCRLNYPMCLINPRPPLYSWTVAVMGKALSPLFDSVWASVTVVFLSSTAVWGALTVFPTYFLTKEAFGRRSAILAAFFLATLPAHLQRSIATNADHDAMVLFFVVSGFFFVLKSLKSLQQRNWVQDWSFWTKDGRTSIRAGLRGFFGENRTAVLYAMLAGWSLTAIALIWQGWAYAPIVLLGYFLFQILVHRLRSQDPMGIGIVFTITVGLPL